jgi:hypothetical protein
MGSLDDGEVAAVREDAGGSAISEAICTNSL